jgi:23S rRNA pseudouridine1911/1915/1917 synthase
MKYIVTESNILIEILLQQNFFYKKSSAKSALKYGSVNVNNLVVKKADLVLKKGDVILVNSKKEIVKIEREERARNFPLEVLFEDDSIVVINKPAGLLSVPLENKTKKSLLSLVDKYIRLMSNNEKKAFTVNRLDRDFSGIVLFAKTFVDQQKLTKNWKQYSKKYYALVEGKPKDEDGVIKSKLKENSIGLVYTDNSSQYAKEAITNYRLLSYSSEYSLLKIEIETDVKNQIRAHMGENKTPIAGDKSYGAETNPIGKLGVHLFSIEFVHPKTGKEMTVKTQVPYNFNAVVKNKKLKENKIVRTKPQKTTKK